MKTKNVLYLAALLLLLGACSKDEISSLKGTEWSSDLIRSTTGTNSIVFLTLEFDAKECLLKFEKRPENINETNLLNPENFQSLCLIGTYTFDADKQKGVLNYSLSPVSFVIEGKTMKMKYEGIDFVLNREK